MRQFVAALSCLLPAGVLPSEEPSPKPPELRPALDRGLAFLARDALAWKSEHKCASCHHAGLVVWSMREAKDLGFAVDEPVLAELTKWVAESGDGKTGVERPASAPKALNTKALYFALALGAGPTSDASSRDGLKALLKTVISDQTENGSWSAWPETRPPFFGGSDEGMTLLATLAVTLAASAGDEPAKATRDRALTWLAQTKSDDDPQSIAMRVVLSRQLGRPAEERAPLVQRIQERQKADGGWSQSQEMASDAWATGQALYALAHAGIQSSESTVERARAFLMKTQRDDGSWPMTSRPMKPGGEGSKSLIPITCAGSAWAILGLVRTR
jgi:hypothetical protein